MEKLVHIKVARAFLYQGKPQPVGTVLEVPIGLAGELATMGKAVNCDPPAAAPIEPAGAPEVPAARTTRSAKPKDETK